MSDGLRCRLLQWTRSAAQVWSNASITQYLLVLVLAIVLPLLGFAAILTAKYVSAERRVVEARRADVTNNLNNLAEREIVTITGLLLGLAAAPALSGERFDSFEPHARAAALASGLENIVISDRSGAQLYSLRSAAGTLSPGHLDAVFAGHPAASDLHVEPASGRLGVFVSVPVIREKRVLYALSALIGLGQLATLFSEARHQPEWIAAIVDRKGRFLARSRAEDRFRGQPAHPAVVTAAVGTDLEGAFDNVTLDGTATSSAFRRSTLTGWTSVVAVPTTILNAPRNQALRVLSLIGAALASIALALAYILGSRVSTAVQSLKEAALDVVEGRSPALARYPISELRDVTRVFDFAASLVNERKQAEQLLHESEERLRLATDAGGFGTWDLDVVTKRAVCSPQLFSLFGYDPTITPEITTDMWEAGIEPADRASVFAEIERARTARDQYALEYRRLRADTGEVRWMRSSGRFIFNDRGESVRLIGVVRDVTDRKRVEMDLRDSEARYRSALTVGRIASWETNFVTGQRIWSPEGQALFGLSLKNGIGRIGGASDEYRNALHPDDRHLMEHFHRLAQTEDVFDAEYRIVHRDGKILWVAGRGKVVSRDATGKPLRLISVVADITERKSAETHVQFLMREISHRSKNLLSVVQAIAGQTSRTAQSPQEFIEIFRERLRGLAVSQDILVNQSWERAPLADLVRQQLALFVDIKSARVSIAGPNVTFAADHTQAIGLALHELATNASKYGALSNDAGKISIKWEFEPAARGSLTLSWVESGGPTVTPPTRKGFGQHVIERMVATSVDGHVSLEFPPTGIVWKLTVPSTTVGVVARPTDNLKRDNRLPT